MPVYITEYSGLGTDIYGKPTNAPVEPALASQTVAVTAGSVQSAVFNPATRVIRIHTDAICSVAIGLNPTATLTSQRFAINDAEFRFVNPAHRVAVIANT